MDSKKVLFLYPNINTELRIPLAISILISTIRKAGHQARLFDTTFMVEQFQTDDEVMAELGTHMPTKLTDFVGKLAPVDIKTELKKTIIEYAPDIVAVSLLERNFPTARNLCLFIKKEFPSLLVLVGGIMPTIASEVVLKEEWVDMIVVGEGEGAVIDILENLGDRDSLKKIKNVQWKDNDNNNIIRNPLRPLIDMNEVPEQDWSDFDRRHMLKPFMGNVYRGGAFEFSRGCSKTCTFCVAPQLRKVQKGLGHYHRTKSPLKMIEEIEHKLKEFDINMISFGDTDFLGGVPKPVMQEFLSLYIDRVGLPFTIQTGAERLIDEEVLTLLRKAGCCAISVGVESGSEQVRKSIIKKYVSKEVIKNAFDLCRKHGLRITANYMVGVPHETENDIWQTIKFNRELNPPSIAVTFFTPFVGTELYDISVNEGFYAPFNIGSNSYKTTPLNMPHLPPERIHEMVEVLVNDFKGYQEDFNPILMGS
jgi:radical SAM superfamily enzyme YgiQ (UPF0313 family)